MRRLGVRSPSSPPFFYLPMNRKGPGVSSRPLFFSRPFSRAPAACLPPASLKPYRKGFAPHTRRAGTMTAVPDSFGNSPHKAPSGLTFALHWHYCPIFHGERTETMSEAHYDRMSKKALINRLLEAERQLRTVDAEKVPVRAPAARRRAGKQISVGKSSRSGIRPKGSKKMPGPPVPPAQT